MTYDLSPEEENKEIARRYKGLLKGAYQSFTAADKKEIRKAFDIALEAHSSQRRRTGEPIQRRERTEVCNANVQQG